MSRRKISVAKRTDWARNLQPFLREARFMVRHFRSNKLVLSGGIIVIAMIALALSGPYFVPGTATRHQIGAAFISPTFGSEGSLVTILPDGIYDSSGKIVNGSQVGYFEELHLQIIVKDVTDASSSMLLRLQTSSNHMIWSEVAGTKLSINSTGTYELKAVTFAKYVRPIWTIDQGSFRVEVLGKPRTPVHLFGTDDFGRDLFSLVILAARLDLSVAAFIVTIAVLIGIALGSFAGFVGGKIDEVLMRITDIFLAFPALILALAVAAALSQIKPETIGLKISPEELKLYGLVFAIIIVDWPTYTRLLRGQVLSEKEKTYVEALRALGISRRRIIFRHVMPNTIYPVLVYATLDIGGVLLTFAALSFLGFGVSPLTPEWGKLVQAGEQYLLRAPWIITFPGLAILITSLAFNLLGDGLRDVLDPRLRR